MSQTAPVAEGLPSGERLGDVYGEVVDIAQSLLEEPVSVDVTTWEDGEIEVMVWYKYGWPGRKGVSLRGEVQFHTRRDGLRAAIWTFKHDERAEIKEMWEPCGTVER